MYRKPMLIVLAMVFQWSAYSTLNPVDSAMVEPNVEEIETTSEDPTEEVSDVEQTEDSSVPQPDSLDQTVFAQLSELYDAFANHSSDLWTDDYRFDQDQAMYVRTDKEGNPLYAYIFNYEDAAALPSAELVDTGHENLGSVYYLSEIPNGSRAENIPFFDFQFPVGDEEIFMMKYSEFDEGFDLENFQWQLFVAHEAMHRYQMLNWTNSEGYQEGKEYDLSAEHISLIFLEQKLLLLALETDDASVRENALMQFVAVRTKRNELWPGAVGVDNQQERIEGMPRYLEYRLAIINGYEEEKALYNSVLNELEYSLNPMEGMTRDILKFGRFYSSGAALGVLLDQLEIDWKARIETGETPFDVLSDYYAIEDIDALIETAKSEQDFDSLMSSAAEAAEYAASEPEGEMGSSGGGTVEIERIRKPYEEVDPTNAPSYVPSGYHILGMFSYSVDEIDFEPLRGVYSPDGEDIVVVDLGNDGGEETEIRIYRSPFHGTLDEYFNGLVIGMPPMKEVAVGELIAKGDQFELQNGINSMLIFATGEELIQIEAPIGLEESAKIMESLLP